MNRYHLFAFTAFALGFLCLYLSGRAPSRPAPAGSWSYNGPTTTRLIAAEQLDWPAAAFYITTTDNGATLIRSPQAPITDVITHLKAPTPGSDRDALSTFVALAYSDRRLQAWALRNPSQFEGHIHDLRPTAR